MPNEKPVFGQVLIREPKTKRPPRVGIIINTGAMPQLFDNSEQSTPSLGERIELGKEPLAYSSAIEHWKKKYREAVAETRMDPEIAMVTYQSFFLLEASGVVNPIIKNLKGKIEKGEELTMEEPFYLHPDFFRKKLLSPNLRADDLLHYGLIALKMDNIISDPDLTQAFNMVGFDLLEAAEMASPRNPKYKLALWREYERKMEERRNKRQKAKESEEKDPSNIKAFHYFNAPEVFVSKRQYYLNQIEVLKDLQRKVANVRDIRWQAFRVEHAKYIEIAKKIRDTRNYNGNKIQYRPVDFDEMIRNQDSNAFMLGLNGLYGVRKNHKNIIEPKALKLLEIGMQLPPPPVYLNHKWPEPWQAFVLDVMIHELYRLLGIKVTGKRVAKVIEVTDNIIRQRGGIPKELTDIQDVYRNSRPIDKEDDLPF